MTVDRVIKVLTAMGGICSQICYKLVIRLHSHDMGITCYQHDLMMWIFGLSKKGCQICGAAMAHGLIGPP